MMRSALIASVVFLGACSTSPAAAPAVVADAAVEAEAGGASKVVGASGGTVSSADGRVRLVFPAGALDTDVTITIDPIVSPAPGSFGPTYELGPTGTIFKTAVTLELAYVDSEIEGNWPQDLLVGTLVGGAWAPVRPSTVDETAATVSARTTHFSPYTVMAIKQDWSDAGADAHVGADAASDAGSDASTEAGVEAGSD